MKLTELTGAEYDDVEMIVGQPLDSAGLSGVKLTRAVGYVIARRADPGLTWPVFNERPVAEQMAGIEWDKADDPKAT